MVRDVRCVNSSESIFQKNKKYVKNIEKYVYYTFHEMMEAKAPKWVREKEVKMLWGSWNIKLQD